MSKPYWPEDQSALFRMWPLVTGGLAIIEGIMAKKINKFPTNLLVTWEPGAFISNNSYMEIHESAQDLLPNQNQRVGIYRLVEVKTIKVERPKLV